MTKEEFRLKSKGILTVLNTQDASKDMLQNSAIRIPDNTTLSTRILALYF